MRRLLAFSGFTHDTQGVLAAIHPLAFMGIEQFDDFRLRVNLCGSAGLELRIAALAHADDRRGLLYDPQLALGHVQSLAHREGWA